LKVALGKAGVKNKMITISGGQHDKFNKEQNDMINSETMNFLEVIGAHIK